MVDRIVTYMGASFPFFSVWNLLGVTTEGALACEEPVPLQLLLPGLGVLHDVDVADEGILRQVAHGNLLGGDDGHLPPREPEAAVGDAGVVQHRPQQVDAQPERLRGEGSGIWYIDIILRLGPFDMQRMY